MARDGYTKYIESNVSGKLKIFLLDTIFWTMMSDEPDKYNDRYRAKVNLHLYDFVVMPMFGK